MIGITPDSFLLTCETYASYIHRTISNLHSTSGIRFLGFRHVRVFLPSAIFARQSFGDVLAREEVVFLPDFGSLVFETLESRVTSV